MRNKGARGRVSVDSYLKATDAVCKKIHRAKGIGIHLFIIMKGQAISSCGIAGGLQLDFWMAVLMSPSEMQYE